ncbi:MAG: sulfite exporter TauE/SafE family protein, partial [Bacteroidetes bacterium]|nr:sulfite exporter TauE/SafE family protein [Bacteroidota bacterium]
LLIIAAKSLFGFLGDVANYQIDWMFLLPFTALSVAGIFVGSYLSTKIHADKLKTSFGWFVLLMGVYIIAKELFFP